MLLSGGERVSKPTRTDLAPNEVKDLLKADFKTGKLYWRTRPIEAFPSGLRAYRSWNARFAGEEAFTATNNHGYRVGCLFGRVYSAHRVLWCLAKGGWPDASYQIDHINGNRTDNALANLRLVSNIENHMNTKRPTNNTSGCVGVFLEPRTGRWVAQIYAQGRRRHLGTFIEKEEAIKARNLAERAHGYHINHGRANG
ncbi:HNH endonuclease [Salipiger bermudensis]|uniref:HNH endonuclease n=1 Tax=Salipiger bermudensis TaxID=344736 RepID=UPI001CD623A2|nr:HNH endonuclease [Salipiger bermudensis]